MVRKYRSFSTLLGTKRVVESSSRAEPSQAQRAGLSDISITIRLNCVYRIYSQVFPSPPVRLHIIELYLRLPCTQIYRPAHHVTAIDPVICRRAAPNSQSNNIYSGLGGYENIFHYIQLYTISYQHRTQRLSCIAALIEIDLTQSHICSRSSVSGCAIHLKIRLIDW